jgi:hypothetical protein
VTSAECRPAVAGERRRTEVNEPKTEPRVWRRGSAADRPARLPAVPKDCRCESADAGPGAGRPLVGTHQDPLGSYEAGSLLIADSERRQIAPLVDRADRRLYAAVGCAGRAGSHAQIVRLWGCPRVFRTSAAVLRPRLVLPPFADGQLLPSAQTSLEACYTVVTAGGQRRDVSAAPSGHARTHPRPGLGSAGC